MPCAAKKHNEIFDPPDTPVDSAMNSTNPSSPTNSSVAGKEKHTGKSQYCGSLQAPKKGWHLLQNLAIKGGQSELTKPKRGKKNKKKGPSDSNEPTESEDSMMLSESDPLPDELPSTKQNKNPEDVFATDLRLASMTDYEPRNMASTEEGKLNNPSDTDNKASQDEDTKDNGTAEESPESDIDEVVCKERSMLETPVCHASIWKYHRSQKPIASHTAKPSTHKDSAHKSCTLGVIVLSSSDEGPTAEKPSHTKSKEKMGTTSVFSKCKEKAMFETLSWKSKTTHNESLSHNRLKPHPATQNCNVSISSALGTLAVKTEPKIVHNAINKYSINILTINAFPDGISKTTLLTTVLYQGAETLWAAKVTGSVEAVSVGDILTQPQADHAYRSVLASLPNNHIGDIHKGFKKAAKTLIIKHYGFGKEDVDTVPIVQNLLYDDTYIYPGNNASLKLCIYFSKDRLKVAYHTHITVSSPSSMTSSSTEQHRLLNHTPSSSTKMVPPPFLPLWLHTLPLQYVIGLESALLLFSGQATDMSQLVILQPRWFQISTMTI
ncbi:hypothetical protein BOTBODRAFT_44410 [Botryobasidium botryosum FD-172 SS1]|uniref:DUF6532 domain-containing protein n=1 Tax=Botryobasidium botryosum (strain FD-172 SS1) TaxID=930990 RepID=A0A067MGK2_BOTB1|nr:hypothetical protein BOTBODRAFT_44410 [Botryobasidium botryosum FD-172 SS1]